MFNYYSNLNIVLQTFIACIFTFSITSLGSLTVLLFKRVNKKILDLMLSLSAGIMISASFWSLLNPAINLANELRIDGAIIVTVGFLFGGLFLIGSNNLFSKKSLNNKNVNKMKRCFLLISSITLHNIPEGLAIGVAFGSIGKTPSATLISALMLAIGVGIQNFPEGAAISLPLRREGYSRKKSFVIGMLSGIVEPISGILGCILSNYVKVLLPFFLSFAAGAMILVVVSELIPESQNNKYKNLSNIFLFLGFSIMMFLDVKFG